MKMIRTIITTVLFAAALLLSGCQPAVCPPAAGGPETGPAQTAPPASAAPRISPKPSASPGDLPEGFGDDGIFAVFYERAYQKLLSMSTEEKVGQMILSGYPGEEAAQADQSFHPGGFILFERDFEGKTEEEVIHMIAFCQEAAEIPLIMAVDEEGGEIVRISSNPNLAEERFLSPRELYEAGGLDAVREDAEKKGALLLKLGLNLNLAPVADVSQSPLDYIYARTLGLNAEETALYVAAVVGGAQSGGVASALKHFPGYGNNVNTHIGIAVDRRPYATFEQSDFLPFMAGIQAGAECVMVSHNIVECMDPDNPASLSPAVHEILRNELGFTGLILTDDLSMKAVSDASGGAGPSVMAVLAGNDILLASDAGDTYEALLAAVESGAVPMQTIDRAVCRILAFKYAKGLL